MQKYRDDFLWKADKGTYEHDISAKMEKTEVMATTEKKNIYLLNLN